MITVVGQSAGSTAVYHTVNSPLTAGLIHAAIAESSIRDPYDPEATTLAENYHNLTVGYSTGVEFLAYQNVTTIAQLRQLSMDHLIVSLQMGLAAAGSSSGPTTKT